MAFGIHKKMDKNIKKIRSRGKKSRGLNQHKIRADPWLQFLTGAEEWAESYRRI